MSAEAAEFFAESASLADTMLPGMAEELDQALAASGLEPAEAGRTLGEYSGARFFAKNPAMYRIVVRLLAEGLPVRAIERAVGVSAHLVEAIRAREAASIETRSYSRMMAGKVRGLLLQAADELRERLADEKQRRAMSTRDLVAAMDRLSSIERDMAGEPQSIQRVIQPIGIDPRIAALLSCAGEAEVVEAEEVPANGLGREKSTGAAPGAESRAGDRDGVGEGIEGGVQEGAEEDGDEGAGRSGAPSV